MNTTYTAIVKTGFENLKVPYLVEPPTTDQGWYTDHPTDETVGFVVAEGDAVNFENFLRQCKLVREFQEDYADPSADYTPSDYELNG